MLTNVTICILMYLIASYLFGCCAVSDRRLSIKETIQEGFKILTAIVLLCVGLVLIVVIFGYNFAKILNNI